MFSRRVFLKNGGLALLSLGFAPAFLARTVEAAGNGRRKILITIFQRGAVDGLNMVVPFGEQAYYQSRPSIGVARPNVADGAVDLDGFFGLHPRLGVTLPATVKMSLPPASITTILLEPRARRMPENSWRLPSDGAPSIGATITLTWR